MRSPPSGRRFGSGRPKIEPQAEWKFLKADYLIVYKWNTGTDRAIYRWIIEHPFLSFFSLFVPIFPGIRCISMYTLNTKEEHRKSAGS
jgi:hypothetical protein